MLGERIKNLEDVVNTSKTFVWAFTQENNATKRMYKHALFKKFLQENSEHPERKILDEYETWMRTIDALSLSAFALLLIFDELAKDKVFQENTNE